MPVEIGINFHFTLQPILAIIIKTWVRPIEMKFTNLDQFFVTMNSLRDGIVLWELQEKKCQQRACQPTDVVQTGQAGWKVFILQWKMVKFKGRSALVIALLVADTQHIFLWKTVDPTSSTNFFHLLVPHAIVEQSECEAKTPTNKTTYELILRYTYFRDFAKSSFYDNH